MARVKDFQLKQTEELEKIDRILEDLEWERSLAEGHLEDIDKEITQLEEVIDNTLARREEIEKDTIGTSARDRADVLWTNG